MNSGKYTDHYGNIRYYKYDKLHRDGDLPAEILANGDKSWYNEGSTHREGDLPAIMWTGGAKFWFKNGLNHRDGGLPAVTWSDGYKIWHKDGVQYTPTKKNSLSDLSISIVSYFSLEEIFDGTSGEFEDHDSGDGHGDGYGDGHGDAYFNSAMTDISEYQREPTEKAPWQVTI